MWFLNRAFREFRLVLGSIWINLALFAALIVIAAALMGACGCYPRMAFGERLVTAFYMTRVVSVPESDHHPLRNVLVFVMPAIAIVILGEGVLRVGSIYLNRRYHPEEWERLMASKLRGHTVLCGVGELGRELLGELLSRNPKAEIVVVDTHPDILQELGLRAENLHNITGDMTSHETLAMANTATASTIIFTSGDDAHNLEAAFKVLHLNPKAEIWVRLYRTGLAEMMDTSTHPNLHFFSPYKRAAEALMDEIGIGLN
jgi:hypothetical protein